MSRFLAFQLSAVLACAGTLAIAQTAPAALEAELEDYLEMPVTSTHKGLQVARLNFLIQEPGSERFFVGDQTGPLYIVDKGKRQPVSYIDFNGSGDAKGLFPKFSVDGSFASGLLAFAFDPDYQRNGVFYTIHLENTALTVAATPKTGVLPRLDASRFVPTKPIATPSDGRPLAREAVLSEWTDSNIRNVTFEGSVREVLRVQLLNAIHPMNDLTFNPTAVRGDAEWRVLYVSTGDGGTGETNDVRRLNPQRLDHFGGAIIRIVPDVREHVKTSQVSENGQYRIPNDNPFVSIPGARKEIFAYGMRNPHRMAWDVPPGQKSQANLLAFVIGSNGNMPPRYETINIIRRGANYGYPLREGPELKPLNPIVGSLGEDNTLPLRTSDTVVLNERIRIQDSALAYRTGVEGLAISNGLVYRGKRWPALQGAVVFGDITSGRLFYARMADLITATDGNLTTLAPYAEIMTNLPERALERRSVRTAPLPEPPPQPARAGRAGGPADGPARGPAPPRPPRIDMRIATDEAGEIYILTKIDGLIRRVVSIK
jgi:hypothetical protein